MQVSRFSKHPKGFTLIELIVVIAILAILAAVSAPAILAHLEDAKRSSAAKTCADIVQAVTSFAQDNGGAFPYAPSKAKPDGKDQIYLVTAGGKDADMIKILSNREENDEERFNTSKEYYLRSDETEDKQKGGLYVNDAEQVELYDPWGSPYYVVLCEENEGCIDPYTKKRVRGKNCLVYSLGPDKAGMPGKKKKTGDDDALEDNVYSWKKQKK